MWPETFPTRGRVQRRDHRCCSNASGLDGTRIVDAANDTAPFPIVTLSQRRCRKDKATAIDVAAAIALKRSRFQDLLHRVQPIAQPRFADNRERCCSITKRELTHLHGFIKH